jgi:ribosomal protein S18 acetylase RimI-like enzyme
MSNGVKMKKNITYMVNSDIDGAIDLWHLYHKQYSVQNDFPPFLPEGKNNVVEYFKKCIERKNAITIKENDMILGYYSWMEFDFHNEKSAFCPIIGHYAKDKYKEELYPLLYNYVSEEWIRNKIFNHLWMINSKDEYLQKYSYELGFGAYVTDAYRKNGELKTKNCDYNICIAEKNDAAMIYDIAEESRLYYGSAPIFLKRKSFTINEIENLIEQNVVFIAKNDNSIIGYMMVEKNKTYDIEQLTSPKSVSISTLGAYIKSEYRRKGIGKLLLSRIFDYCNKESMEYIHVCFENANINGNKFWRKYFNPGILSVRRTVNKDANS